MSDLLFELVEYNLRPEARGRLAKVSGIVLNYSDLYFALSTNLRWFPKMGSANEKI